QRQIQVRQAGKFPILCRARCPKIHTTTRSSTPSFGLTLPQGCVATFEPSTTAADRQRIPAQPAQYLQTGLNAAEVLHCTYACVSWFKVLPNNERSFAHMLFGCQRLV